MKNKTLKTIALLTACLLWIVGVQAQTSVNASGGDASGSGGSVAYSVGQVVYTAISGSGGSAAQGVQHAFEIYSMGVDDPKFDISLRIYPNPTSGILNLQVHKSATGDLFYRLFDLRGRLISAERISSGNTKIDMTQLASATYFIKVTTEDNRAVKTFKVIKN